MSRFCFVLICTGMLLPGLLFSAPAKADPEDLTVWAATHGFVGTNQTVLLRGSLVCADLAMGDNGEQAAQDLWLNTGIADINAAGLFVIAAVDALCPQYDHRPGMAV